MSLPHQTLPLSTKPTIHLKPGQGKVKTMVDHRVMEQPHTFRNGLNVPHDGHFDDKHHTITTKPGDSVIVHHKMSRALGGRNHPTSIVHVPHKDGHYTFKLHPSDGHLVEWRSKSVGLVDRAKFLHHNREGTMDKLTHEAHLTEGWGGDIVAGTRSPLVKKTANMFRKKFLYDETTVRPHANKENHYVLHGHEGAGRNDVVKHLESTGYVKQPTIINKNTPHTTYKHPKEELFVSVPKAFRKSATYHVHEKPLLLASLVETELPFADHSQEGDQESLEAGRKLSKDNQPLSKGQNHRGLDRAINKQNKLNGVPFKRKSSKIKAGEGGYEGQRVVQNILTSDTELTPTETAASTPVGLATQYAKKIAKLTGGNHTKAKKFASGHGPHTISGHKGKNKVGVEHHLEDEGFVKKVAKRNSAYNMWVHPKHKVAVGVPRKSNNSAGYSVYHTNSKVTANMKPQTATKYVLEATSSNLLNHVKTALTDEGHNVAHKNGTLFHDSTSSRVKEALKDRGWKVDHHAQGGGSDIMRHKHFPKSHIAVGPSTIHIHASVIETAKKAAHNIDHQGYRWHTHGGNGFTLSKSSGQSDRVGKGDTFGVRVTKKMTHIQTSSGNKYQVHNAHGERMTQNSKQHNVFHH